MPPHLAWADRLRYLATFMVVVIHVATPYSHQFNPPGNIPWWTGNLFDGICRPAVPLFVMLSGYLLLGKQDGAMDFLKKRLLRVAVPALFWMIVYTLYNRIANTPEMTLTQALAGLVSGPVHFHLWFVYMILGLYLATPIIRPWVQQANKTDFLYFFALVVLAVWTQKTLQFFFHIKIGLHLETFAGYTGYFVAGYYLGKHAHENKKLTRIAGPALMAGLTLTVLGAWLLSDASGQFENFAYDYLGFPVGIAATSYFVLAMAFLNKTKPARWEKPLAAASFGIYLVHVLVRDGLLELGWPPAGWPVFAVILLESIVVFGLSYALVALIRLIPTGRHIV